MGDPPMSRSARLPPTAIVPGRQKSWQLRQLNLVKELVQKLIMCAAGACPRVKPGQQLTDDLTEQGHTMQYFKR